MTEHDGGSYWLVFNVGDSRVYQYVDGYATVLSVDDRSLRDPDMITQSIGGTTRPVTINVHQRIVPLDERTRFLICTDGLSGPVSLADVQAALAVERPLDAVYHLVTVALGVGAPDNVSVIVVDWTPEGGHPD